MSKKKSRPVPIIVKTELSFDEIMGIALATPSESISSGKANKRDRHKKSLVRNA